MTPVSRLTPASARASNRSRDHGSGLNLPAMKKGAVPSQTALYRLLRAPSLLAADRCRIRLFDTRAFFAEIPCGGYQHDLPSNTIKMTRNTCGLCGVSAGTQVATSPVQRRNSAISKRAHYGTAVVPTAANDRHRPRLRR